MRETKHPWQLELLGGEAAGREEEEEARGRERGMERGREGGSAGGGGAVTLRVLGSAPSTLNPNPTP